MIKCTPKRCILIYMLIQRWNFVVLCSIHLNGVYLYILSLRPIAHDAKALSDEVYSNTFRTCISSYTALMTGRALNTATPEGVRYLRLEVSDCKWPVQHEIRFWNSWFFFQFAYYTFLFVISTYQTLLIHFKIDFFFNIWSSVLLLVVLITTPLRWNYINVIFLKIEI